MAALGSGNWTISFPRDRSIDTVIKGKKKYTDLKLKLASGEVAAGGVKMPGAGSVGMVRNLDHYIFQDMAAASGVFWKYSATGNLIRPYVIGLKMASGMTATGRRGVFASGSGKFGTTGAALTVSGQKTSGTVVKQLGTGVTIAAQTFYVTAVGW